MHKEIDLTTCIKRVPDYLVMIAPSKKALGVGESHVDIWLVNEDDGIDGWRRYSNLTESTKQRLLRLSENRQSYVTENEYLITISIC